MDDIKTVQVWADGEEWIVKKQYREYFYRIVNSPDEWKPGIPSGLVLADIEALFNETELE